jgi:NitT/TauT family transport system permease protein
MGSAHARAGFPQAGMNRFARVVGPGAATLVIGLVAWEVISLFFLPVVFPGPLTLLRRVIAIYSDPASWAVVAQSLVRIFTGFAISMLAGTAFGIIMGSRRDVEIFFDSWIMVLLTVPAVCWAFLCVLWFGISDVAPIVTIVLIVFPFVVMNIWEGTKALEKPLIEMGSVYGANRRLMLRKVVIPQLLPYGFSSLRIALSLSWKIALVAEAFGAGNGVGQELINWFQDTRVDMMLAWGVSFMILMVLIDLLVFRFLAHRAFAWRPEAAT